MTLASNHRLCRLAFAPPTRIPKPSRYNSNVRAAESPVATASFFHYRLRIAAQGAFIETDPHPPI